MKIWHLIPIILILSIIASISLIYIPTKECPSSCDDNNPCTFDWCNSTSEYNCSHEKLDGNIEGCYQTINPCSYNTCLNGNCININLTGNQTGCFGSAGICKYYTCSDGTCIVINETNCCGNDICESNENCSLCSQDCGSCPQITMKDEYQRGEFINASVNFSQKIYVGHTEWILSKYENGEWKSIIFPLGVISCTMNQTMCGIRISPAPPYPGCREINATQIRTYTWDQKIHKAKTIHCSHYATNEIINWDCGYYELTGTGRYKLRFQYTTDCPVKDEWGKNTTIKYIEKEFSIIES